MKRIKNILLITIISVITFGCSDYLDVYDKTSVSPDVFPTTMEQMDLLTNSMYANTHSMGLYGFYWFPLGVYLYDHSSDLGWIAENTRNFIALNKTEPSGGYITSSYTEIFKGVQLSNTLLESISEFEAGYAEPSQISKLNYLKGQALFMRAWSYWHAQIFCQLEPDAMGVPLMEKPATTVDEMMMPRSTTAEYWAFMVKDLTEASSLLAGYTDPTRATEWAAKAFLAKVYAQSGDWTKAKPALKDVIDNSGKELVPFETYKNMFNGDSNYEFNRESLFEIDLTVDMNTWGAWTASTGSSMPMVFAPTYVNTEGKPTGAGWSNNFVHDKNVYRFGFDLPIPTRTANPDYDASKDVSADNMDMICSTEYVQASLDMRANKTVDPRLFISCAQPFIDTMTVNNVKVLYHHFMDIPEEFQAWSHKKFTNLNGPESDLSMNSGANIHFLRLADIYLLYAEACKDSEPAVALEYINKVKRRAFGYPVDGSSPVDYKSLSDRTMAQSGDHLANDPLKYERWAELFAEGQWWFDIRRWKIGPQEAKYYEKTRAGTLSWSDLGYVQPIPQTEMERNKNMVQNPY